MKNKLTYYLQKDIEWGETVWVMWAHNCSPFGRYATKAAAMADARLYGLRVEVVHTEPRRFASVY